MGKKSTPPPPPVPDYRGLAQEEQAANQQNLAQQTWANRPTLNTPWGSQTWNATQGVDPATGQPVTQWASNINLSGQQQQALDSQMAVQTGLSQQAQQMLGRVQQSTAQPFDWNNLPGRAGAAQAGQQDGNLGGANQYISQAGDAVYDQAKSRLDPRFAQQQSDMETRLRNQGITPNSAAWQREMDNLNRSKTDAYNDAAFRATQFAGQEGSRMQGMDAQSLAARNQALQANYQNARTGSDDQNRLRQQAIAEQTQQRNTALNEMNALLTGQQVQNPSMPSFQNAGMASTPNLMQAGQMTHQGQMAQWNAQQAQQQNGMNNLMSGLGSAASIAMMFSDSSLKSKAKYLGKTARGTDIYSFEMYGRLQIGVFAEDAPSDAVTNVGGVLAVDYSKV